MTAKHLPNSGAPALSRVAHGAEISSLLTPLVGPAYGLALHVTASQRHAEDVVSEAVAQASAAYSAFDGTVPFDRWFLRHLINTLAEHEVVQNRGDSGTFREGHGKAHRRQRPQAPTRPDGTGPRAKAWLGRVDGGMASRALRRLPVADRMVATMYFLYDLSYADMAAVLDRPVQSVRARLHDSREALRNALREMVIQEE